MAKITLTDTLQDIIVKMSDCNPGAVHALMDIYQNAESIDPQSLMKGLGPILLLDTLEIYGTDIYILYNDKCNRNLRNLLVLLRAYQLGFLPQAKLIEMSKDQMRQIELTTIEFALLDEKVCEELDQFQKPQEMA